MQRNLLLTITSVSSVLLLSFHLTQDSLRAPAGTRDAGPGNLVVVAILFAFLSGAVLLAGRRSGYVLTLLGSIFAAGMPVLHLTGSGLGPTARSFFFLWTLIALGVTGMLGAVLSIRGLWRSRYAADVAVR